MNFRKSDGSNNTTTSENSSIYSNIFRSKKNSFTNLNKLYNDIHYTRENNTITKTFFNRTKFDWELYMHMMLYKLKLNIVPEILHIEDNKDVSSIQYAATDLKSLRSIFESNNNFHYIINELLSFLKQIQIKKIIIGNLHIDNIYLNLKTMQFYIMDLSNTDFTELSNIDLDIKSLYISLHELQIKDKIIKYFDQEMDKFTKTDLSKYSYTNSLLELYQ